MKTKAQLNALKEEVETVNKKFTALSEEELAQVSGGTFVPPYPRPQHSNPLSPTTHPRRRPQQPDILPHTTPPVPEPPKIGPSYES